MYELKFKTVEYKSETLPICKLCNSNLLLSKHFKNGIKDSPYYIIIKCSNNDCQTNIKKLKRSDLYLVFLPNEIGRNKVESDLSALRKRNLLCIEYYIHRGFTEEEGIEKIRDIQSNNSKYIKPENRIKITKEYYKEKLGYSDEEIKNKTLTPTNIKFWINKGYSQEDAKIKIKEIQKNASKNVDRSKLVTNTKIEFYINKGYSEKEAHKLLKDRQTTFSLKKCVKKYGEIEGLKRWKKRQILWQQSLLENGNMKSGYSKVSQELFDNILNYYNPNEVNHIYYATNKGEKIIRHNDRNYQYDFTDEKNKKMIEYHGDQYHANPNKYKEDEQPHPYRNSKSKDIWDYDLLKENIANKNGYDVLVIWDSEYKKNKEEKINKCLKFLNKL